MFDREVAVRPSIRTSALALIVSVLAILAVAVPAASAAPGGGFAKFFAGNCNETKALHEECGKGAEENPSVKKAEEEGEQKAGAFVPFGVTDFTIKTYEANSGNLLPGKGQDSSIPLKALKISGTCCSGCCDKPAGPLKRAQHGLQRHPIGSGCRLHRPTCPKARSSARMKSSPRSDFPKARKTR